MEPRQILALNAFDPSAAPSLDAALAARTGRRGKLFGAASVLFYDSPLEFVRGEGCWLYDAGGAAYLDAYNNVPSVGHCHPRVVEAVVRQLGLLNIHNRYLHDGILDYAERLLATFPTALSNITFTCTGSESNDLAIRLAAHFTGAGGVIVTRSAYHGNTALVTEASPTLCKQESVSPHVRLVPAPDSYRVAPERLADQFAEDVVAAIADLEASGIGFAALLVDSIFSSDGVFPGPPGFMRTAINAVQSAGGLFIADEVQCGFGRCGDAMWGFQRHGVLPDVVTLGKPMGNGYPIGAVVTRPDILEAFCSKFGYFNTYAGTPVAAVAGVAVLEVLEQEGLMDNARRVGTHLRHGVAELAARHGAIGAHGAIRGHGAIGDVRGAGLYSGVEMVEADDLAAGRPAPAFAQAVVNGLRERRVLIGTAGMYGNVLKIRPPLCFSIANADLLIATLDEVLTQLAR